MENKIILRHDTHLPPQTFDGNLREIVAIHRNNTVLNIIESADQIHDRRLACACRSDKRNRLSRLHYKTHVGKHLCLRRRSLIVCKADMGKFHSSLYFWQFRNVCRIHDICLCIQNIKNSLRRRQVCHQIIVKITQIHNRVPEHIDVRAECNQKSD